MEQIFIGIFGAVAIWLTQQGKESLKRYAPILGLLSQPFWFYTTWKAQQWGIFGLSFIYAYSWWIGFRHHWLGDRNEA